jgi:hypothetical protein
MFLEVFQLCQSRRAACGTLCTYWMMECTVQMVSALLTDGRNQCGRRAEIRKLQCVLGRAGETRLPVLMRESAPGWAVRDWQGDVASLDVGRVMTRSL